MATQTNRIKPAAARLAMLAGLLVATFLGMPGCSGRTAPVTGGPTSSGGSTAPNPAAANPAPPDSAPPAPAPTRGAQDFARTPPTTPPGR